MADNSEMVCVEHKGLFAQTPKALGFRVVVDLGFGGEGQVQEQWVPKSLVEDYDDKQFWVQRWFAEKEGLDYV